MTGAEERLRDALHASAGRVADDRLRPLPDHEPQTERRARRRKAWRAWLIPAAAAASVALVVSLAVALTGGTLPAPSGGGPSGRGPSGGGPTGAGSPQPPGYFADFSGQELGQPTGVAVLRHLGRGDLSGGRWNLRHPAGPWNPTPWPRRPAAVRSTLNTTLTVLASHPSSRRSGFTASASPAPVGSRR